MASGRTLAIRLGAHELLHVPNVRPMSLQGFFGPRMASLKHATSLGEGSVSAGLNGLGFFSLRNDEANTHMKNA